METSAKSGLNVETVSFVGSPYSYSSYKDVITELLLPCKWQTNRFFKVASVFKLFFDATVQAFLTLARDIKNKMDKKNVSSFISILPVSL